MAKASCSSSNSFDPNSSNDPAKLSIEVSQIDDELSVVDLQLKELKAKKRKLMERKQNLLRAAEQRAECLSNTSELWESPTSFDWSERSQIALTTTFGLTKFRSLQLSAINATMSGEDVLLIMSTGGGKSLCYQLPALICEGTSLIISPLISLMEDQIMALDRIGVAAATLTGSSTKQEVQQIQNAMTDKSANLKLLYVTPEKLAKSKRFMAKLEKMNQMGLLSRIAIDEVHCCSTWGHEFRPDYKFLNVLKRQFPGVPIIGLTATATAKVLDDVKEMLDIPGALVFRAGFNRHNLFYEVRRKPADAKSLVEDIASLLTGRFKSQSGIIYCFSKKESEMLTKELKAVKIKAAFYHADVPPDQRSKVHRAWVAGSVQVVIATIAFGMGIDKPDVRFVIHHSMSKSMENYYQESGRAGRDDKPAHCILYYRLGDLFRLTTMMCTEKTGAENVYSVLAYCTELTQCRRVLISRHFDETWDASWCNRMCDLCVRDPVEVRDADIGAATRQIVRMLDAQDSKVTGLKLVDIFCKASAGLSADLRLGKTEVEDVLAHLLLNGYLKEHYHFTPYNIISYVIPGVRSVGIKEGNQIQIMMKTTKKQGVKRISSASIEASVPKARKSSEGMRASTSTSEVSPLDSIIDLIDDG